MSAPFERIDLDGAPIHDPGAGSKIRPKVVITCPVDGDSGPVSVPLQGHATDPQDGDISTKIQWSSSVEGPLGTGSDLRRTLKPGAHTISAKVADSDGLLAMASVDIMVKQDAEADVWIGDSHADGGDGDL